MRLVGEEEHSYPCSLVGPVGGGASAGSICVGSIWAGSICIGSVRVGGVRIGSGCIVRAPSFLGSVAIAAVAAAAAAIAAAAIATALLPGNQMLYCLLVWAVALGVVLVATAPAATESGMCLFCPGIRNFLVCIKT